MWREGIWLSRIVERHVDENLWKLCKKYGLEILAAMLYLNLLCDTLAMFYFFGFSRPHVVNIE